jgi:hypothetical protein
MLNIGSLVGQVLFNLFVAILIMGVSEEKTKAFKGQEEEVRPNFAHDSLVRCKLRTQARKIKLTTVSDI